MTRRGRTSPACSSPRAAASCAWSRPTRTGSRSRRRSSRRPLEGSLEANVPARTLQELGRIAGAGERRHHRRRGAREPGRLHGRRRGAVLAPGRGPLPELPAAAARVVRARAAGEPRGAARGRAPRRPAGAEERAAAPALRRGRARRLRPDPGRRRGQRVAAGAVRGRTVGDRLQPGVLPRRARERRVRGADPEADQPAAPGPDPVGRRGLGLHLPRHADPPNV